MLSPTQAQVAARIYARDRASDRRFLGPRGFAVRQKNSSSPQNLAKLDAMLAALEVNGDDQGVVVDVDAERPRTRGDCIGGQRPCPFVSCRHHLALDITESGSLHVTDHLDLEAMTDTCSLDVADRGEHTLDAVGQVLNVTRERVRQLETKGLEKAKALAKYEGLSEASYPFVPDRNTPTEA